jgi:hypothetical protein
MGMSRTRPTRIRSSTAESWGRITTPRVFWTTTSYPGRRPTAPRRRSPACSTTASSRPSAMPNTTTGPASVGTGGHDTDDTRLHQREREIPPAQPAPAPPTPIQPRPSGGGGGPYTAEYPGGDGQGGLECFRRIRGRGGRDQEREEGQEGHKIGLTTKLEPGIMTLHGSILPASRPEPFLVPACLIQDGPCST